MSNKSIHAAKKAKNDEFYTLYRDVEDEMRGYIEHNPNVFKGKTILLPCDDPEWSNFTKYFAQNFEKLGLKKLISNGDGDFRSEEVKALRDEADIIITNPPFSLFREFLSWINEANKKFIIMGNMNAITYKEVFPLIQSDKLWLGFSKGGKKFFEVPESYDRNVVVDNDGKRLVGLGNTTWFTNVEHTRRHERIENLMTKADNKKFRNISYQKYDNYCAIEVSLTNSIPSDHKGVMGVPISFLDKYCPEQFEILGATQRGCHDAVPDTRKYDDYWEVRSDGTKTGSSGGKTNENANLEGNDGKKNYFTNKDGHVIQSAYQRIFIKHR